MLERKFVKEGITRTQLDAYLKEKLKKAGYVGVEIQKTPVMMRIAIRVERPGLVIGKRGSSIQDLTKGIEQKFGYENVQIKVDEIPIPELDATVMAKRIASSLEKGMNYRRLIHYTLDKIKEAGAKGAEIVISGKLVGKGGMARTERVSFGYMKKAGEPSKLVREAKEQAIRKAGIIGVVVRIVPPDVVFEEKKEVAHGNTESKADKGDEPGRNSGETESTEE